MAMALKEFDLIRQFFAGYPLTQPENRLGIGDDCALLALSGHDEMVITTDTMVEGVHFFPDVNPEDLGHKLLAVNLSDLAAMGAQPFAVMLALTLPKTDEAWLAAFAKGFMGLAQQFGVDLIGGDTTSGPLTLTVQAFGKVPQGTALLRSGAKVGDGVYVSGLLGDAGLGLKIKTGYACATPEQALQRFHRPLPRVAEGLALRGCASACIDLSDGLASDLKHILNRSAVGACIDWEALPLSDEVQQYIGQTGDWALPLCAGDDYELCFTVSPQHASAISGYHKIGVIEAEAGLRLSRAGRVEPLQVKGFEHFS